MKILFIADNALHIAENGKTTELPSYRIQKYKETIRQIQDNKAWKTTGRGAQFMGVAEEQRDVESIPARIGGAALHGDELLYTVVLDASGGLYSRDFSEKPTQEGHICSGNDSLLEEIACHGEDVAACLSFPGGQKHIGLYHLPASYCTELTDGDSVESSPSWSPDGSRLYFSTCGIGRGGQRGLVYSPQSIAEYNMNTQHMEILLEDEKTDYLCPKTDAQGNLWYIRRPYTLSAEEEEVTLGGVFKDVVLFPYRLVKALFGLLNMFSIFYGGESLNSQKTPRTDVKFKQKSEKDLFFEGNLIHAEQNEKENQRSGEEYPGILPRNRVLVRRASDGTETVIAKAVLDYALCADGTPVYSNGSHILHLAADGKVENLAKIRLATKLSVIE